MTWQQWLIQASSRICFSLGFNNKHDAAILLAKVTGSTKAKILAFGETLLTNIQQNQLEALLVRRERGEPIAYIIKEQEFWSLKLHISSDTLIPRPDTECLVQRALELFPLDSNIKVLDLGTGSGAIALALASERPSWQITGIDSSLNAIKIARNNAVCLKLKNIFFKKSNWFQALNKKRYNLIVSNPPYIKEKDPHLLQGDLRFEPLNALVAGKDGLKDLTTICCKVSKHMLPGCWLLLEHAWNQGLAVRVLLMNLGLFNIKTVKDYGDNDRVSQGQQSIY